MSSTLEKTEKKIKETDHQIGAANNEIIAMQTNIRQKEELIRDNEKNYAPKSSTLTTTSTK